MSLLGLCNLTATLKRATTLPTVSGGKDPEFTTIYSDFPCTIQPVGGTYGEDGGRIGFVQTHMIYTPTWVDCLPGDIVEIGSKAYTVVLGQNMAGRNRGWSIQVTEKL